MLRSSAHSLLPVVSLTSAKGKKRLQTRPRPIYLFLLVALLGCLIFAAVAFSRTDRAEFTKDGKDVRVQGIENRAAAESSEPLVSQEKVPEVAVHAETLVLYVHAGTDPEYVNNLHFFLREGVHAHDGCEYVIAVQEGPELIPLDPIPKLPPNARFVRHENKCFDLGTVGWMLQTQIPNISQFRYFIWLNSSVRGPFLPAYVKRRMHWTEALTDRLTARVKMVGATINCGGAHGVPAVPHVQSYLVAVDQIGYQVLMKEGNSFRCWDSLAETVIHGELGASAAIFMAGYSIDCLMLRYQGVNWRSKDALDCNGGLNPIQNNFNDGINVDALETLFVKVKASMRAANWTHVQQAAKYDEWSGHERGLTAADLQSNAWSTHERPRLLEEAERRGTACFDWQFYHSATPGELSFIRSDPDPAAAAWHHFLSSGIREGRPFRYTC